MMRPARARLVVPLVFALVLCLVAGRANGMPGFDNNMLDRAKAEAAAQAAAEKMQQGRRQFTVGNALTDAERDALCTPMMHYTEAEVSAFLTANGLNATVFAGWDGAGMKQLGDAEDYQFIQSLGFPPHQISKLINLIQTNAGPSHGNLPPAMDPCSHFYTIRGGNGTETMATTLVENLLDLNQDEYTFTVIFQMLVGWHEDRIKYLPRGTQKELDGCVTLCSRMPSSPETCPGTEPCRPSAMDGIPRNKCCDSLWTPFRSVNAMGLNFANALEIETLYTIGPMFLPFEVTLGNGLKASFSYVVQRFKGTFSIPLMFKKYPRDTQLLDIYFTFIEPTENTFMSVANGTYGNGGEFLPESEAEKFKKGGFEAISGWSVDEDVEVLQMEPAMDFKLWFKKDYQYKFKPMADALQTWIDAMAPGAGMTIKDMFASIKSRDNFGIIRLKITRNPQYYEQNIVTPVVLLNCLNFLALMLGPDKIGERLASCATVILALMTFQIIVTDQLPVAGYPIGASTYLIVSNTFMIVTGIESVIVYWLHSHNVSPFGTRHTNEALMLCELRMLDTLFIVFYICSYLPLLITLTNPISPAMFLIPFITLAVMCLGGFTVLASDRLVHVKAARQAAIEKGNEPLDSNVEVTVGGWEPQPETLSPQIREALQFVVSHTISWGCLAAYQLE